MEAQTSQVLVCLSARRHRNVFAVEFWHPVRCSSPARTGERNKTCGNVCHIELDYSSFAFDLDESDVHVTTRDAGPDPACCDHVVGIPLQEVRSGNDVDGSLGSDTPLLELPQTQGHNSSVKNTPDAAT